MEIVQVSTAVFPNFYGSLNFDEICLIQKRRVSKSSQFIQIGHNLHEAAKLIDSKWDKLSSEEKESLKDLAYGLIEPSLTLSSIFPKIWAGIYLVFIKVTGQERSFHFCLDALDCLVDSILDAIENEQIFDNGLPLVGICGCPPCPGTCDSRKTGHGRPFRRGGTAVRRTLLPASGRLASARVARRCIPPPPW